MAPRLNHHQRRAQIVETAAALFAKKGFYRTTTREIARKVGVSEAMIFKHFARKEKLYASILDWKAQQEDPLAEVRQAAQRKDDLAVFEGLARHFLIRVEKDPYLLRLLLFSALEHHRLAETFVDNHVLRIHYFLRDYIKQRVTDGDFQALDPLLAARSFVGMVSHHILAQEIFGMKKHFSFDRDEIIDTFVRIFLKGVRK
jgi:AcrR family transcriptional regulator